MATYGTTYNSPYMNPYGPKPPILTQEEKDANAAAFIAQRQAEYAAANPQRVVQSNPFPTTDIPAGSQVNPRQGGQQFQMPEGILSMFKGRAPHYASPALQTPTEEFNMTSPENLQPKGPERYVPAPIRDSVGQGPMTEEERSAFMATPAGQRLLAAQQESQLPAMGDQGAQTGGRRDSTALAAAKKNRHVSFAEAMGRYGGAIMNAGSQGGMAQVGAMGNVTGEIADIERAENNRIEQEQEARQKVQQEQSAEFDEIIGTYDSSIAEMDRLYADVFAAGDELTGPYDGFMGKWIDNLRGNPEAYTRLAMDQFKVDEILKNVAKTKGAISDREMETFERPMPSMMADEDVWLDWIYEKRAAAISVRNKLKAMQGGGGPSNYSSEDQALIDQYSR